MNKHTSNFDFLQKDFPFLGTIAQEAESYLYSDPPITCSKFRFFAKQTTDLLSFQHGLFFKDSLTQRKTLPNNAIIHSPLELLLWVVR